jgi:hypothetical protein
VKKYNSPFWRGGGSNGTASGWASIGILSTTNPGHSLKNIMWACALVRQRCQLLLGLVMHSVTQGEFMHAQRHLWCPSSWSLHELIFSGLEVRDRWLYWSTALTRPGCFWLYMAMSIALEITFGNCERRWNVTQPRRQPSASLNKLL